MRVMVWTTGVVVGSRGYWLGNNSVDRVDRRLGGGFQPAL